MRKPEPANPDSSMGGGDDLDAETELLGRSSSDESSDASSDGIPDHMLGVVDEPDFCPMSEVG